MLRRCVSILVIAGFLASQLASLPHAHGNLTAAQQKAHDATPHFHCEWLNADAHGHEHHGSHAYDHGSSHLAHDVVNDAAGDGLAGLDHDAHAIFLHECTSTGSTIPRGDEVTSACQVTEFFQTAEWLGSLSENWYGSSIWHPPDKVLDGSDIYLILRNLRI